MILFLKHILIFIFLSLSSSQVGKYLSNIGLPMITGYMACGILAGPFVLDLISHDVLHTLGFVDELALSFIAFVAGSELYWKEIQNRIGTIKWVTFSLVVCVSIVCSTALYLLSSYIPFMAEQDHVTKLAISMLAGSILIARSPSSAIAVIKEMRAKGPFTQTALGVTVILDVVVILIFSMVSSYAVAITSKIPINPSFFVLLFSELVCSVLFGFIIYKIFCILISYFEDPKVKIALILSTGFSLFQFAIWFAHYSHEHFHIHFAIEPLLSCMVTGYMMTNFSNHRSEFESLLHKVYLPIYVIFFTVTGASLHLGILAKVWPIAFGLFLVRIFGLFIGSFSAGTLCKEPPEQNKVAWMAYVTQAGIGLGLAQSVSDQFPVWGADFAALIISVIIISTIIGPPTFRWVLLIIGEAHPKATKSEHHLTHKAVVFGSDDQSEAIARQLKMHQWQVFVCSPTIQETKKPTGSDGIDLEILPLTEISLAKFQELNLSDCGAIVANLSDEENLQICEIFFEHFANVNMVVQLSDRINLIRFSDLGCKIVLKSTAITSLLDHYVRSPSAVSLLFDDTDSTDIVDLTILNPNIHGLKLAELNLPEDVLILSIQRDDNHLNAHSYLRLKMNDIVTVSGSFESLKDLTIKFDY
ncbi:MAG: potassium transporter TrkA [Candidatus Cloacimonadota bacterium]|nr:MAG: potassium transporter TrkA [Candidatus Cloacimonadota bacterium]